MQFDKQDLKILKLCLLILIIIPVIFIYRFVKASEIQKLPEGEWYCEELQLQIGNGKGMYSYAVVDGEIVECVTSKEYHSSWIQVVRLLKEDGEDIWGEKVFSGKIISVNAVQLVLEEESTCIQYHFLRVTEDTQMPWG